MCIDDFDGASAEDYFEAERVAKGGFTETTSLFKSDWRAGINACVFGTLGLSIWLRQCTIIGKLVVRQTTSNAIVRI